MQRQLASFLTGVLSNAVKGLGLDVQEVVYGPKKKWSTMLSKKEESAKDTDEGAESSTTVSPNSSPMTTPTSSPTAAKFLNPLDLMNSASAPPEPLSKAETEALLNDVKQRLYATLSTELLAKCALMLVPTNLRQQPNAPLPPTPEVEFYGGIANGFPTKSSDVDITVMFNRNAEVSEEFRHVVLNAFYQKLLASVGFGKCQK